MAMEYDDADLLKIRDYCLQQLIAAYEDAGFSGLCGEGRWEYALDRLRQVGAEEIRDAVQASGCT